MSRRRRNEKKSSSRIWPKWSRNVKKIVCRDLIPLESGRSRIKRTSMWWTKWQTSLHGQKIWKVKIHMLQRRGIFNSSKSVQTIITLTLPGIKRIFKERIRSYTMEIVKINTNWRRAPAVHPHFQQLLLQTTMWLDLWPKTSSQAPA